MTTEESALLVRDVYKSYDGQKYVLNGLNMTVDKGTIYGLLGPSGCGKSTLLNAMVGLVGLEGGEISSMIRDRADLGFMPQQIALHERMTVNEIFNYFAKIYGLTEKQKNDRSTELLNLLEIPNTSNRIATLSGGQKRRLSLAITLIHSPSLVLLDEPTVGVDPVLRENIWGYLLKLAREEGKTVIITTHYIQEATMANKIGLMRSGVLVCEDTPQNLVVQNGAKSLEEVFLRLSHLQEAEILENERQQVPAPGKKIIRQKTVTPKFARCDRPFKLDRFKAEVTKNFLFIRRDYWTTMFTILVPLCVTICFHFAIGQNPSMSYVGIMSEEVPHSSSFCSHWKPLKPCDFTNLTCLYLNKLGNKSIGTIDVINLQEGVEMVKRSEIWGVIHFSRNFSQAMHLMSNTKVYNQNDEDEMAYENGEIEVHLDRSNVVMDTIITNHLYDSLKEAIEQLYGECGWPQRISQIPIKFDKYFYGKLSTDLRTSFAPALINILMITIPMMYGVVAIMEERESGATARSVAAGVTPYELLASHLAVQLFIHVAQLLAGVLVMYGVLEYQFENPIIGLSLLFMQGLPGIAISFFIPLIFETSFIANYFTCGFVVANALSCGAIWPIEGLHPLAHSFAWLLPTYFSTPALRNANFKGWDLPWRTIFYGYASLCIWTIVLFVFIIIRVRMTQNRCFLGRS